MKRHFVIGTLVLFTSCSRVPDANDEQVKKLVHDRLTKQVHWDQAIAHNDEVQSLLNPLLNLLLEQEMSLDAVLQIALLNNPEIQATFQELGIAHADLVQAGLFQNPFFEGFIRFPNRQKQSTNSELSINQGFLDIFLIPLKKKIKTTELEQAEFLVASRVLELAFSVQETYYKLQAEEQKCSLLEQLKEATGARALLATRQYQAGNISQLSQQKEQVGSLLCDLQLVTTKLEIATLRRKMQQLLGLAPSSENWRIKQELATLCEEEASVARLKELALSQRLDVAHVRLELKRFAQIGATKEWWAMTNPSLGISSERDTDGTTVLGPTLAFALPFFDHGQAERARLLALVKQSQHRLKGLELEVAIEVKKAQERVTLSRQKVLLVQEKLLPLQRSLVASSQAYYNQMALNLYSLLQTKEDELQTAIEYQMTLCDYWLAKVALERAVGGTNYQ